MKHVLILLLSLILDSSIASAENSTLLAEGNYWTNGVNGSHWSISVFSDGLVRAEEEKDMMLLEEPNVISTNISSAKITQVCSDIENLGFFLLPNLIAPEAVSLGGPEVSLHIKCAKQEKKVNLYSEFNENEISSTDLNKVKIFKNTWALLWRHSSIVPQGYLHWL